MIWQEVEVHKNEDGIQFIEGMDWDLEMKQHLEDNPIESILDMEDDEFRGIEITRLHNKKYYIECDRRMIDLVKSKFVDWTTRQTLEFEDNRADEQFILQKVYHLLMIMILSFEHSFKFYSRMIE